MRFTFEEKTDLSAREAAKASGVEEIHIVTGWSSARRKGLQGFNAGGKYFGIVGAEPPAEKPAKPMLDAPQSLGVPEKPGSTCTPKHPAPARSKGFADDHADRGRQDDTDQVEESDQREALGDPVPPRMADGRPLAGGVDGRGADPEVLAGGPEAQRSEGPVTSRPEPAEKPDQPEEPDMGRVAVQYHSDDHPGKTFTAEELAKRFGMHPQTVRNRVAAGQDLSGIMFRTGGDKATDDSSAKDAPPRAPKTRRRRNPRPALVADLQPPAPPPSTTGLVVHTSSLQAQRDRYRMEFEAGLAALKTRYDVQMAVLEDLERNLNGNA